MEEKKFESGVNNEQFAFDYYKIHSNLRITHFNYFLVGITALLTILVDEQLTAVQMMLLGLFLSSLSVLFYYFDLRNKELIKISEEYLSSFKNDNSDNFFSVIEQESKSRRQRYSLVRKIFRSHGRVYKVLYLLSFLAGVVFIVFGLVKMIFF
jgi:Ca2+/Na+ antiporter